MKCEKCGSIHCYLRVPSYWVGNTKYKCSRCIYCGEEVLEVEEVRESKRAELHV